MSALLHNILFMATLEVILGLVVVLAIRTRQRLIVGLPLNSQPGSREWLFLLLPVVLGVLLAGALQSEVAMTFLAPGLLAAVGLIVLQPRRGSNSLGEEGVCSGWRSSRLDGIEQWRLMGDHLRVLVAGEWRAMDVPVAEHPALRKRLESICAERESRFKA